AEARQGRPAGTGSDARSLPERARNAQLARSLAGLFVREAVLILARLQPQFLELAIERGTSDAEASRDFGHVAVIARDREPDHFGFYVFELAHVAVAVDRGEHIRRGDLLRA